MLTKNTICRVSLHIMPPEICFVSADVFPFLRAPSTQKAYALGRCCLEPYRKTEQSCGVVPPRCTLSLIVAGGPHRKIGPRSSKLTSPLATLRSSPTVNNMLGSLTARKNEGHDDSKLLHSLHIWNIVRLAQVQRRYEYKGFVYANIKTQVSARVLTRVPSPERTLA